MLSYPLKYSSLKISHSPWVLFGFSALYFILSPSPKECSVMNLPRFFIDLSALLLFTFCYPPKERCLNSLCGSHCVYVLSFTFIIGIDFSIALRPTSRATYFDKEEKRMIMMKPFMRFFSKFRINSRTFILF